LPNHLGLPDLKEESVDVGHTLNIAWRKLLVQVQVKPA